MQTSQASWRQLASTSQAGLDRFLVCGLGSVGQHCVIALKEFGISVSAIETVKPQTWEIPNIPNLLEDLIIGDCRQPEVLEQAKIRQCRAVLIVTSNENMNAETAFAARALNPQTRLVVRSGKENLNELLSKHLGNFVAFEPTQLPAAAFALAALGTETSGLFKLEGEWLRVVKRHLSERDRWSNQRLLHEINTASRRVVNYAANSSCLPQQFYQWNPDTRVQAGDTIAYIEVTSLSASIPQTRATAAKRHKRRFLAELQGISFQHLKQKLVEFWQPTNENQIQRVALVCGITILILLLSGTVLYRFNYPEIGWREAFYATSILLLGGFGDVFGGVKLPNPPPPWWLQLFSLMVALTGTAIVGVLYGLITEKLLSARFQLIKRRPPVPQQDHVVLVGLGRLGQRVAALLQEFKQPVVGLTNHQLDPNILPQMPMISGNFAEGLKKANVPTAKSIVVTTDDDMVNLEVGLMAHGANPTSNLIIRTSEQRLSNNLARLLPDAQVLSADALVAEAFAGAAFGENILYLFRLSGQTILVTEYNIESIDTLHDLLLAEVAYGYGAVPILHRKAQEQPKLMPSDDTRLAVGDTLVVLATIDSLRRIEHGELSITPKHYRVRIEKALNKEAVFEGANAIARVCGCNLSIARDLMKNLPATLPTPLYPHQAQRLVRSLDKIRVQARIVPIAGQPGSQPSNTANLSSLEEGTRQT